MLGEKREVNPHEYDKELGLSPTFRKRGTRDGREPEGDPGEDAKYGPHGEHVMEVRDNVIGIMQSDVEGGVGEYNTREAPYREKEQETKYSQHRGLQGCWGAV